MSTLGNYIEKNITHTPSKTNPAVIPAESKKTTTPSNAHAETTLGKYIENKFVRPAPVAAPSTKKQDTTFWKKAAGKTKSWFTAPTEDTSQVVEKNPFTGKIEVTGFTSAQQKKYDDIVSEIDYLESVKGYATTVEQADELQAQIDALSEEASGLRQSVGLEDKSFTSSERLEDWGNAWSNQFASAYVGAAGNVSELYTNRYDVGTDEKTYNALTPEQQAEYDRLMAQREQLEQSRAYVTTVEQSDELEAAFKANTEALQAIAPTDQSKAEALHAKSDELNREYQKSWNKATYGQSDAEIFLMQAGHQGLNIAADSLATIATIPLGGWGGKVSMAGRIYGQTASEARRQGDDVYTAAKKGITSAAIETISEMIGGGFDKVYGESLISGAVGKFVSNPIVKGAIDALGEGAEEGLASVMQLAADHMFGWSKSGNTFLEDVKANSGDMVYEMLLGTFVGVFGASGQIAIDSAREAEAIAAFAKVYGGSAEEIIQQGLDSKAGSKAYRMALNNQEKLAQNGKLSDADLYKQFKANVEQIKAEGGDEEVWTPESAEPSAEAANAYFQQVRLKDAAEKAAWDEVRAKDTAKAPDVPNTEQPETPKAESPIVETPEAPKQEAPKAVTPKATKSKALHESYADIESDNSSIESYAAKYENRAADVQNAYSEGQDVEEYGKAFDAAYRMGESMLPERSLGKVQNLTDEQKQIAFQMGRDAAKERDTTRELNVFGKGTGGRGVVSGDGISLADVRKKFNDAQNTAYRVLDKFARATGMNIVLFSSDETGSREEGSFSWKDNTIRININSGVFSSGDVKDLSKYTALRTFSHELTHFTEKWNAEQYDSLREFVFEALDAKGVDVDERIQLRMAAGLSYDMASREVVADSMADMLGQSDIFERLAQKDAGMAQSLLNKLKEFLARLKQAFKSMTTQNNYEAEVLKDTIGYSEELVKKWTDALEGSIEAYNPKREAEQPKKPKEKKPETSKEKKTEEVPLPPAIIRFLTKAAKNDKAVWIMWNKQRYLTDGVMLLPVDKAAVDYAIRSEAIHARNLEANKLLQDIVNKEYGLIASVPDELEAVGYPGKLVKFGEAYFDMSRVKAIDGGFFYVSEDGARSILKATDKEGKPTAYLLPVIANSEPKVIGPAKLKSFNKSMMKELERMGEDIKQQSFVGRNAENANYARLDEAIKLEEVGQASPEEIRQQTGWFRGYDGKWRFEISDRDMEYYPRGYFTNPDVVRYRELSDKMLLDPENMSEAEEIELYASNKALRGVKKIPKTLGDYVKHDNLFEAYPQLRNVEVRWEDLPDNHYGSYRPDENKIVLNYNYRDNKTETEKTLIHEIQHAIQAVEGLAFGSTPAYWQYQKDSGFDARTSEDKRRAAELERQYHEVEERDPKFFEEASELMLSLPKVPRGKFDFEKWEQIEEDPPEWTEFDRKRDELSEKYGGKLSEFMTLYNRLMSAMMDSGRSAERLYMETAGEIEARDTEERRNLTDEQRKNTRPDIDREDVVFSERSGGFDEDIVQSSIKEIVGESGEKYGRGVYLDSELLTNLSDSERVEMVKEYVKEIGGSTFTAYDQNGNEVLITIARAKQRFINAKGKRVAVNKDLVGKYNKNKTKQEAVVLVDELISTSKYIGSKAAQYPHGWLDNNGKNDWQSWSTYLEDKNNTIWEATLYVATAADGEKYLYDIGTIKKVERSRKSDASTTDTNIPQTTSEVNGEALTQSNDVEQTARGKATLSDRELLEAAAARLPREGLTESEKLALVDFQKKLDKLKELQEQRAEQGRIYKEQMFTKGRNKEEAQKTKNRMDILDKKINSLENTILSMKDRDVFKKILKSARNMIEREARASEKKTLAEYRAKRNESEGQKKYRDRVIKTVRELMAWISTPSAKEGKRVPLELQDALSGLLSSIDFTSKRALKGGNPTKQDIDFKKKLQAVKEALDKNIEAVGAESGYVDIRPEFSDEYTNLLNKIDSLIGEGEDYVINRMSSEDLKQLSELLKEVKHYIQNANTMHENEVFKTAHEAGDETIKSLGKLGKASKLSELAGRFFTWYYNRPAYVFSYFGKGGESVYQEFRKAQGIQARLTKEVLDFSERTFTPEMAKRWAETTRTFNIDGENVKIPITHIMSMYCLSKREQGLLHLLGGGFRVANFKNGKQTVSDVGHKITKEKLDEILATLDQFPAAKKVADELQKYMSTVCAAWGNEVDMVRFGVPKFLEKNYFPVNSDGRQLAATADEAPKEVSLYALLNAGFTKSLQIGANNRLIVYDIFDVFASHTNSMVQYRSFALPVLDALKWFNHKNGQGVTVRDAMSKAFGSKSEEKGSGGKSYAEDFVINLLKDYNGARQGSGKFDTVLLKGLSNINRTRVSFNLSTMLLQPTSIARAGMFIGGNKLLRGFGMAAKDYDALAAEMEKHSGIALWKSLGFYDVNVSRGVAEQIKQDMDWKQKFNELGMKGAEAADRFTWTAIWAASKASVNRAKYKTDAEYFEAVNTVFEEVIYKTQVVDSVLTKAEAQREKGFGAKSVMSFMSESVASTAVLSDAAIQYDLDSRRIGKAEAWKKNRKHIGRAVKVWTVSKVISAAVSALVAAWRDDDEYEEFGEKYFSALKEKLIEELNPLSDLPLIGDVISMLQGYDDSSELGQIVSYFTSAWGIIGDKLDKDNDGDYEKYTWWGAMYKVLQGTSAILGVPFATASRELVDLWNNTAGRLKPEWKLHTYDPGVQNSIKYAYDDGYIGKDEAIKLLMENTEENEMAATFMVDEWAMQRETGIRYSDMQKAYVSGVLSDEQVIEYLVRYGHEMERDAAEKQLQWKMEIDTGIKYSNLKNAYIDGEVSEQDALNYLVKYGGLSQKDAEAKVLNWEGENQYGINIGSSTMGIKAALINDFIDVADAKHIMMTYDGKTAQEAEVYVNQYLFTKETGYSFSDIGQAYANGDVSLDEMVRWYERAYSYSYGDREDAEKYAQVEVWKATVPGAEGFNKTLLEKWEDYGYNTTEAGLGKADFAWAGEIFKNTSGTDSMDKGEVFYRELYNRYQRGEITFWEMEALARSFYSSKYYKRYKFW